jgi:RNA polymerase sigma-70 factor (ECF subfamily)
VQTLHHGPTTARRDHFATVYRAHHDFVWRTLRHLGVDADRIDDALQDTFLVVYRRMAEFEGRAALRTWIFEIARRVAARYRRSAAREAPRRCELAEVEVAPHVEDELARAEAAEILREFLDGLDPDKSVVFIMAELEQRRVPEIADALAVNLNTVYARLRAARQQLDRLIHRLQARDRRPRRAAEVIAAALAIQLPATAKAWSFGHVEAAPAAAPATGGAIAAWSTIATGLAVCAALAFGPRESPARPPAVSLIATSPAHDEYSEDRFPTVVTEVQIPELAPAAAEPPTQRPRVATRESAGDALARELALIEPARAALLAGDAEQTLRLLARHRRQFPAGMFAQEAAATRIEALCRLGDGEAARSETDAFARRWPESGLATRAAASGDDPK